MDLVTQHKNELVVSHRVIAKATDNQDESIFRLINTYKDEFELNSPLRFEIGRVNNGKGEQPKTYLLNEEQSTFLLTLMKNNKKVVAFKRELVSQFFKMKQYIAEKAIHREDSRLEYKLMSRAVKLAHNPAMPYHYSNEADLINSIVIGMSAKKYKELNKVDSIRDNLQPFQLEAIAQLERMNTSLIEIEQTWEHRKDILTRYYNTKLLKRLEK